MAADGSIIIDTKVDTSGFGKSATNLKSQFSGLASSAKKLGAVIAAVFSVRAIVAFGQECIELGSDLQEVQNVVDVTFTTMNEQVNQFAQNAAQTAGLSETMAKKYVGTFGAMAKSFQFAEEEAYAMSTALTQLTGDVASFYNLSQDEAYTKLKSVFTGETESLKDLGVVMTQTALDDFALRKGLEKTTSEMTEQQKVALRYQFVMEQLSGASGDFVRTSDSWANQTRILSLQFDSLKASIGQGLISALTPVIQVINQILAKLQVLANAFKAVMSALFGTAAGTSGSGVSQLAEDYNEAAEGAENLAAGVAGAGKAAEKAKKQLAGFDELNRLQDKSAAGGSGGGGSADGQSGGVDLNIAVNGEVTDNVSPQVEGMVEKIRQLIEPLRTIDLSAAISSFQELSDTLADFGEVVSTTLEKAWFEILVPLSKWTMEKGTPAIVNLLSSAFKALSAAIKPVIEGIESLLDWLQPVFSFISDTVMGVLEAFEHAFYNLAEVFEQKSPEIEAIFSNLGEVFVAVWTVIEPALIEMRDAWRSTFDLISSICGNAIAFVIDVLYGLTEFLAGVFTGDWNRAWGGIESIFGGVCTFVSETANDLLGFIGPIFQDIAKVVNNAWAGIQRTASTIWNSIVGAIRGAVNGIIGAINGMISGIVNGINSMVRTLNRVSIKIPSSVPFVGGKSIGFNASYVSAPQIPYLARGAVIPPNAPFMAMLGDQKNGKNIEAPLETIQEAVAIVMDDMIQSNIAGFEATVSVLRQILEAVLGISIGDDVIGEAVSRYNAKTSIIRGGNG